MYVYIICLGTEETSESEQVSCSNLVNGKVQAMRVTEATEATAELLAKVKNHQKFS